MYNNKYTFIIFIIEHQHIFVISYTHFFLISIHKYNDILLTITFIWQFFKYCNVKVLQHG